MKLKKCQQENEPVLIFLSFMFSLIHFFFEVVVLRY